MRSWEKTAEEGQLLSLLAQLVWHFLKLNTIIIVIFNNITIAKKKQQLYDPHSYVGRWAFLLPRTIIQRIQALVHSKNSLLRMAKTLLPILWTNTSTFLHRRIRELLSFKCGGRRTVSDQYQMREADPDNRR